MKNILLVSLLTTGLLSGCSTINFEKKQKNDVEAADAVTYSNWHHNIVFSLIEVSSPVNLNNKCGKKSWSSVKTELSFINGVAGGLVNYLIGPIWYPKTVEVTCN